MPRPRPGLRYAATDGEIGALGHLGNQPGQRDWRQRSVGVQYADQIGGRGDQARVHRGAVTTPRLGHHRGAARSRDRDGVIGTAVVDDDGAVAGRHGGQHSRQRLGLIEAGQHDVHRGSHNR